MSDKAEQFIRELLKLNKKASVNHICKVIAVRGKLCDVEPIDGGATITGVRLSPVIDNSEEGLMITPEDNSYVMVSEVRINENESKYYVASVSRIKDMSMITASGEKFSLTKTEKLIEELNKNNQLLTAILNVINTPVNEPGNGLPSAFQAALKLAVSGKNVGNFTAIKNERIKHA